MTAITSSLIGDWARAATPPPLLTVSEWSDAKRRLPETSAAQGGRWRTERTPYLRGIMDAVHEPGVRIITLIKCVQSGGSESLHNILGYHIEHKPCSMLVVHPTEKVGQAWSKERLGDMIRSTPALRAVVRTKRGNKAAHEAESTLDMKMFPNGFLAVAGANSPNTFARWAARLVAGDDIDRWPPVIGDEGDPTDLLINRGTTFHDSLALFVSTPTLKQGRIDTFYLRSDRRRFFITCPGCGHEDWITWNGKCEDAVCGRRHFFVAFDDGDKDSARVECPACEHHIDEAMRRVLIAGGSWKATATAQQDGSVGFHLPAMVSTLGDVTLPRLVGKWLASRGKGKESLRVFINTQLAQGWEDRGARMEPHVLMARREDYGEGIEVPAGAVCLTAGVDVQENPARFEVQVQAWGPAMERWVVDYRVIHGDPKSAQTQAELLEVLSQRYTHASGHRLPILSTCVDTGHFTFEMYDFVLAHQHVRKIFATKGFAHRSGTPIVGKPTPQRKGRDPRPVNLWPINVDDAKTEIYSALAIPSAGPNAYHFPFHLETVDEEFFAQLCAEHKETVYNKSGVATHTVWVQDRERNEVLDNAVLCLAAFKLLNPNIRQMAQILVSTPVNSTPNEPGPATPGGAAAAPRARRRRSSRSPYLP